jgi:hypothetical protein
MGWKKLQNVSFPFSQCEWKPSKYFIPLIRLAQNRFRRWSTRHWITIVLLLPLNLRELNMQMMKTILFSLKEFDQRLCVYSLHHLFLIFFVFDSFPSIYFSCKITFSLLFFLISHLPRSAVMKFVHDRLVSYTYYLRSVSYKDDRFLPYLTVPSLTAQFTFKNEIV